MGKQEALTYSFNVGEKSTAGLARIDQEGLKLAAEVQENLLPRVVGAAQVRPGFEYLGTTASNKKAVFLRFVKSVDDTALIELTDGAMRVWVDDSLVTYGSVTSTVTNGDFSSSAGWTLTTTSGATADIDTTVAGCLVLRAGARGSSASCVRSVSTSSAGQRHALLIQVTSGPVTFKCGSTSGGDDYIPTTSLDTGLHSLAFTPSGTYYVYFEASTDRYAVVNSIAVQAAGTLVLPGPWAEAELPEIRYDQSGDILFLAHTNWQQRKIERRATDSWSLVKYYANDGPFTTSRTANVRLKPTLTFGNTTLTSDKPFFKTTHVGALFRLTHSQVNATFKLGADQQYTDAIRVSGIGTDNDFQMTTFGTWTGTVRQQRGYTDRKSGFVNTGTTYTVNAINAVSPGASYDNVIHYYRFGFDSGDLTSGVGEIRLVYSGDAGSGVCRVTAYNSSTSVDIEVLVPFKNEIYTEDWTEGEWSDKRGWPSAVMFFDGRLWWARDDKFWASLSDQYYSFTLDEGLNPDAAGDAGSIQKNIATGGSINTTQWMLPLQRPIFGTTGAETDCRSDSLDGPLTPTKSSLKDVSTQGAAAVSPIKIDGRGFYVQRSGERIYELSYGYESNGYTSRNMMRLNEDIGTGGLLRLAVQRQPETYIWTVRADGQIPLLIYEPNEKIAGFVRIISDGASGEIEDIVTLPDSTEDAVYICVKRTINGTTKRYLERMAKRRESQGSSTYGNKMADSFVYTAGAVSTVSAPHLASQTGLIACGFSGSTFVVLTDLSATGAGSVVLGQTLTKSCVGLPYKWRYKSAKLAYATQGTPAMQPKRVGEIGINLSNFSRAAINYGPEFSSDYGGTGIMFTMPSTEDGQVADTTLVNSIYDEQTFPFGSSWGTDSRVCLAGSAPYPATLLGLLMDIETNQ